MEKRLIKINMPGGVVSAGDLYEILIIAEKAGAEQIRIGNRQQLYFNAGAALMDDLESDMLCANIDYEIDQDRYPNIISSYIADGIFNQENWLKEGTYKDLLDLFDHQPLLKINIVDASQCFIPFFTGNLNFISSERSNYWHLYVRYPKTNLLYCWPDQIYSDDIPVLSKLVESTILSRRDLFYDQPQIDSPLLYEMVMKDSDFGVPQSGTALTIPEFDLVPYEGLNRYGNKYWLGIYRRDEIFLISFLKELCNLCIQTRVGQVYFSSWKSILVKNIDVTERNLWSSLICQGKLNLRHSGNELNWQTEDLCDHCLELKYELVKAMDALDIPTAQLSFAISKSPKSGLSGSVLIREIREDKFEIRHTRNFNPNVKDFVVYQQEANHLDLVGHIADLCRGFYEIQADTQRSAWSPSAVHEIEHVKKSKTVHQCKHCLTIYDQEYGDPFNGIPKDTLFESLQDYCCPTCEAVQSDFTELVIF